MIRGIYTAASGMSTQMLNQEVLSNNIANVDTTGFKKDVSVNKAFSSLLINRIGDKTDRGMDVSLGTLGTGVQADGTYTHFSQGALKATENKLDVALDSEGFFVVQAPEGERYTRDGSFTITAGGELVTKDGYNVLGQRGTINVGSASDIVINQDGSIVADNQVVNQLRIVDVGDRNMLRKVGRNQFALAEGGDVAEAANFKVLQGYLEASNVNVVSEMVNLISLMRAYEANQKSIASQDDTLGKLISDVGRT